MMPLISEQRSMRVPVRAWASLVTLSLLWGSSFMLVEIALSALAPRQIVGLRLATGAVVLLVAMWLSGQRPAGGVRYFSLLAFIALSGNCVPFLLISWAQVRLESGLAGILAATSPLCVLLLSHFTLHDERLEARQAGAFVLAFAGVVLLLGAESLGGLGGAWPRLVAQFAILGAAVLYAVTTVLARRLPSGQPVATAAMVMVFAALFMAPAAVPGLPAPATLPSLVLLAVAALGLFGTGLASVIYFRLVAEAGARFTSLLNFLVPVWAAMLGTLVLGERLAPTAWIALVLILAGLLLTQPRRSGSQLKLASASGSCAGALRNSASARPRRGVRHPDD